MDRTRYKGAMYKKLLRLQGFLVSPFLLLLRISWGWQFFQAGKGKLTNIDHVVGFFQTLGIPMPLLNAYLVGGIEMLGGLCLLVGFASRLATVPLAVVMLVAYLTADRAAFFAFFSDSEAFVKAAPFPFLMTVLIVMLFGSGFFSVDRLIKKKFDLQP